MDQNDKSQEGLVFRLSECEPPRAPAEQIPSAVAEPISAEETRQVLARLPELEAAEDDQREFRMPGRTMLPPQTARSISTAFPPPGNNPASPADSTNKPRLEVLSYAPEGEVEIAARLTVTFSQPMIPVGVPENLPADEVPVRLIPQPPGNWQWLDTKTLQFIPDGRFPQATHYEVTIPKATTTPNGARLESETSWTFTTRPPKVVRSSLKKDQSLALQPLIFLAFDQEIDPKTVLPCIQISSGQSAQLVSRDEIQQDKEVQRLVEEATPNTWLVFRPAQPLAYESDVTIKVLAGTPSVEGPLTTTETQSFEARTHGPFRVASHHYGHRHHNGPENPFSMEFTNALDASSLEPSQIRVEPSLPELDASGYDENLIVYGQMQPSTTYRVTLAASLRDEFGQTLGEDVELEFCVGSVDAFLDIANSRYDNVLVLEPGKPRVLPVRSVNHKMVEVELYKVEPEHWAAYQDVHQDLWRRDKEPKIPGELVLSEKVKLPDALDEFVETDVDLTPALGEDHGHAIVVIRPMKRDRGRDWIVKWVQATNLGLTSFEDDEELIVWATDLVTGQPASDIELQILPLGAVATTDKDGLARMPSSKPDGKIAGSLRVSTRGILAKNRETGDTAILRRAMHYGSGQIDDRVLWYVFDDRGIYRPGEQVRVKGWSRFRPGQKGTSIQKWNRARLVDCCVRDSQRNEILTKRLKLDPQSGFDIEFTLPADMNLGMATLSLKVNGHDGHLQQYRHGFQVQEFRRPEYEVSTQSDTGPHFVGQHAAISVEANYYSGGSLPDADVRWSVYATPGHFTPPGRDDFTFGKWTPWWEILHDYTPPNSESCQGKTDGFGQHSLRIDFEQVSSPRPSTVTAEATVTDVNRQEWSSQQTLLVHPAEHYVGLRPRRMYFDPHEPIEVDYLVTDLDGNVLAHRSVVLELAKLKWEEGQYEWRQVELAPQQMTVESACEAATATWDVEQGGTYRLRATVRDDVGRSNQTEMEIWVAGETTGIRRDRQQGVEHENVELIPQQRQFQPGDRAELLLQAPFSPAEGLLTVNQGGILHTERFTLSSASQTLAVEIDERYYPAAHVHVELVGQSLRCNANGEPDASLPKRPAYAGGAVKLDVPPRRRTLSVTATPQVPALEPGGETTIDVHVQDSNGQSLDAAELSVIVVDEAILSLTNYQFPDPIQQMYTDQDSEMDNGHSRQYLLLGREKLDDGDGRPKQVAWEAHIGGAASMADDGESKLLHCIFGRAGDFEDEESPLALRKNFNPLALFVASAQTNSEGSAEVPITLPDNLTRYRIMVVAAWGDHHFGKGESTLTARLPLMVRPSPPRVLNIGDRCELPVVVQNQTEQAIDVLVATRAANLDLLDGAGYRVSIPGNDRVETRFPVAAFKPGTARLQFVVAGRGCADAATAEIPVLTPATTEAYACYGEIDDNGAIRQSVEVPQNALPDYGQLAINTSSTALASLTDAMLYLAKYPYECSEQIASRVLAVAALRDVLTAFQAEDLPTPAKMELAVKKDIALLEKLQHKNGGFAFWRREDEPWPLVAIHVAHALQRAQDKGFDVPSEMFDRALNYLRHLKTHLPAWYPESSRLFLLGYALHVRHRAGDSDREQAAELFEKWGLKQLPLETTAWLIPLVDETNQHAILQRFANRATQTAAMAHFVTEYEDGEHLLLHSDRRADAIILEALIDNQPDNPLIPKIVQGLLAHRTRGRWSSTQENAFVLSSLDRYFATYESVEPDFVARIWLGDQFGGEHRHAERTTDQQQVAIPMTYLQRVVPGSELVLSKDGPGRLYYRIGLDYATADLSLLPVDRGFHISRNYEAVDDPQDVKRDEDGTWHIRAGATVRIQLQLIAPTRRYHVALVDPLPAGLEPFNPALAVTSTRNHNEQEKASFVGWNRPWFEYQNLRDDRVEAFTTLLWAGVHNYTYLARATTPGQFIAPPAKAEEMYHPETFGRGQSERVIVH